jgi:hypothetical protein
VSGTGRNSSRLASQQVARCSDWGAKSSFPENASVEETAKSFHPVDKILERTK